MTNPTPDELRKFMAGTKILSIGARHMGLTEQQRMDLLMQVPTPFGRPVSECTEEEARAINDAAEWKDVLAKAAKARKDGKL